MVAPRTHLALAFALVLVACGDDPAAKDTLEDAAPDTTADAVDTSEDGADTPEDTAPEVDAVDAVDALDAPDLVDTWAPPRDRAPGERTPPTARCDPREATRCLLPWPSSAFLAADGSTPTGVRVSLEAAVLPDEQLDLLAADGFSRLTPIVTTLPVGADPSSGALRLFVAEPGPDLGREVPLSLVRFAGRDASDPMVLVGYPLAPLAPASEHLIVLHDVRVDAAFAEPEAATRLALGLTAATTPEELALAAYHAPARALLAGLDVPVSHVLRVWDFTTRSAEDPRASLRELAARAKEAVVSGAAAFSIDRVELGEGPIDLILEGRIGGLPDPFVGPDATFEVPFRVVVPAGTGDYHVVLYCHGTSGNVRDTAFDQLVAESGAAKVNVEIDGWTDTTVVEAVTGLLVPLVGTRDLVVRMRRAIAGIAAIHASLIPEEGRLGKALGAPTLLGVDNPLAGRYPRPDLPIWAGGSLGGVIGMVYGHLEPTIVGGVLNVPGAGFTHWLAQSGFSEILDLALVERYPAMVDQQLVAAMSQTLWDEVDGAAWAGARATPPVFLVQMSVGDPIMPNLATSLVATSLDAVHLLPEGATPLVEVPGLERALTASGRSALTEFKTVEGSPASIHGFAAGSSPAGVAARAQFGAFVDSIWQGAPTIAIPEACFARPSPGVCDFSAP